jgi:hypothetical protein
LFEDSTTGLTGVSGASLGFEDNDDLGTVVEDVDTLVVTEIDDGGGGGGGGGTDDIDIVVDDDDDTDCGEAADAFFISNETFLLDLNSLFNASCDGDDDNGDDDGDDDIDCGLSFLVVLVVVVTSELLGFLFEEVDAEDNALLSSSISSGSTAFLLYRFKEFPSSVS